MLTIKQPKKEKKMLSDKQKHNLLKSANAPNKKNLQRREETRVEAVA